MSDATLKALRDELKTVWTEFQDENDKRIDSRADVIAEEKVNRINNHISELQEKLDAASKEAAETKNLKAQIDELEAKFNRKGLGSDGEDPKKVRNAAEIFFAAKRNIDHDRGVSESDVEAYSAYRNAYTSFLKRGAGDNASAEIKAALSVGSEPDGGYWVPTEMSSDIKTRLFETSPMRQVSSVISITTDSIEFPTDTNDSTTGGWVGETGSRTDTATPQVGNQTIYAREQYAQPKVTQKLLDMATINVEAWINAKIADKLSRVENTAFVSGTGVKQPRGFLDYKSAAVTTDDASRAWGVLQYVPVGAAGAFPTLSGTPGADDPNALITVISKLKPAYRQGATWFMNRATEAAVRKLRDNDGRHLVGMGDIRDGATGFNLFGFSIVTGEDMPDIASNSYSMAFGNFSVGYQIVDGRGIRILRDPFTDKPYVKFYTTKWTGGDVVNFDAIKLVKFAAS